MEGGRERGVEKSVEKPKKKKKKKRSGLLFVRSVKCTPYIQNRGWGLKIVQKFHFLGIFHALCHQKTLEEERQKKLFHLLSFLTKRRHRGHYKEVPKVLDSYTFSSQN